MYTWYMCLYSNNLVYHLGTVFQADDSDVLAIIIVPYKLSWVGLHFESQICHKRGRKLTSDVAVCLYNLVRYMFTELSKIIGLSNF